MSYGSGTTLQSIRDFNTCDIAASIDAHAKAISAAMRVYQGASSDHLRSDLLASTEVILERLTEDFAVMKRGIVC